MLVITLREGDYIMIGEDIKIQYDHINGKDHLALGIEAPRDLSILRGKVYEENLEAKAAAGDLEAQQLSKKLRKEYAARRKKAEIRRITNERLKENQLRNQEKKQKLQAQGM